MHWQRALVAEEQGGRRQTASQTTLSGTKTWIHSATLCVWITLVLHRPFKGSELGLNNKSMSICVSMCVLVGVEVVSRSCVPSSEEVWALKAKVQHLTHDLQVPTTTAYSPTWFPHVNDARSTQPTLIPVCV